MFTLISSQPQITCRQSKYVITSSCNSLSCSIIARTTEHTVVLHKYKLILLLANRFEAISIPFVLASSRVRRHNICTSDCRKLARRNICRTGSPRPKGCSRSTSPRESRNSVRHNLKCRLINLLYCLIRRSVIDLSNDTC